MLQPRESDIPALLIFLVVIPLFTYIFLGRWSETSKKKARISALGHLAAEEAFQVEAMASADVLPVLSSSKTGVDVFPVFPSSRIGSHKCARCSSPATTRCSRCKSVRYCSGKCQIIHWRQGHKHECLQWHPFSVSASLPHKESLQQKAFLNNLKSPHFCNVLKEPLYYNLHNDMDDPLFMAIETCQDSDIGRKPLSKGSIGKLKSAKSDSNNNAAGLFDQHYTHDACAQTLSTNHFTEVSSEDTPAGHKLVGGNLSVSSSQIHMNQGTSYSSNSRNVLGQHSKSAGETRKGLKQSGSPVTHQLGLDVRVITACPNGANINSEEVDSFETSFSSSNETNNVVYPIEHYSTKESIMYRKPPYTLGHTASSLQKLAGNTSNEYHCQGLVRNNDMGNGSGILGKNVASNLLLEGLNGNTNTEGRMAGSKKTSRELKRNLVGLINDNKKNKLRQVLFPYEELVKFFQCEECCISPRGLLNCGNSCYANAVLQCLTGTKPLMVYLLRRWHSQTCCIKEWCLMCELEQHVSMLREAGGPLSPSKILSNMRNIGCQIGGGNQEDAHEFLRLLVMSMQSVCLEGVGGEKGIDPRLQETTLIQQIFGGRLKSKVKCSRCHLESERYESIMDLTLEIHGWVESLEDALTQFTAPEDLDGENMYRCARCLAYVKARKQLCLHEVPNILTIVLKRFQTGKYGKINKCVTFPDMLDMIPFVTGHADNPPLYLLYAVVVHLDNLNSSFTGHYISYVKDLEGTWFRIDDSEVKAVPPSQVMSEGAYMLFYSRSSPRPPQVYNEQKLLRPSICAKRNIAKGPKASKHEQQRPSTSLYAPASSAHPRNDLGKENGDDVVDQAAEYIPKASTNRIAVLDGTCRLSMDFSDVTSSDWSLFTSSDDSSFTTESTRDSFSTVDNGDNTTTLDAISSIFSPVYVPDYANASSIECARPSLGVSRTRFFTENSSCAVDSSVQTRPPSRVHKGKNDAEHSAQTRPSASVGHCRRHQGQ